MANPKQKNASEKISSRRLSEFQDFKKVFSSEQGRRVLNNLIANHHMMGSTYVKGDAVDMAFREGQRQVVLRIMTIMKYEPQQVIQAIKEADEYVRSI